MRPAAPILETRRLLLRPIEIADAEQVQALFPQWEVVRHLTSAIPWPYPPDGALTFLRDEALPAMARGDAWHWSIRLKTHPAQLIGLIGVQTLENNNRGFWVAPPWQRQGLMTEASDAVTDFWFDVLGFGRLTVPKAVDNAGSRRISEKSGMRVIATKEQDYISGRLPTEVWEITAEEWSRRRARRGERSG